MKKFKKWSLEKLKQVASKYTKKAEWVAQEIWQNRAILEFIDVLPKVPSNKKQDFFRRNSQEYTLELELINNRG